MRIRPTVAVVDLEAIRANLALVREVAAPGQAVCAVVKADGYGHGITQVARTLEGCDVEWLGVFLVEEGLILREAGVSSRILVMGGALEGGFPAMVKHDLVPVIFRREHLSEFASALRGARGAFHLKVDTGMARLGVPVAGLASFLEELARYDNLRLEGLSTHFANADLGDRDFNEQQLNLLREALSAVQGRGHAPRWVHLANSAAVLSLPAAHTGLLRPGLMLYGLSPFGALAHETGALRPAMRWLTRPIHLKTVEAGTRVSYGGRWVATKRSRIATLPVGYADGYPRLLGNRAEVLICGKRAPIVGTVCMDACMADVTHIPDITLDSEVVLMGRQGQAEVTAYDLAERTDTIPYEILTRVGARVPRAYVGEAC